jgi:CHAT domain-containing protein/tetratricopeptide (TPR) repeat protein
MTNARRLRLTLAILIVAVSPISVRPQDAGPLDAIKRLLRDARYLEAEAGARAAFAQIEVAGEPESLQAARVIDALVEALWRGGKVRAPETRTLAERSVAVKEKLLGPDHSDVAYSLTSLGIVVRLRGDYPLAKTLFERALAIQEKALGPRHAEVARTLTASAGLAADAGDLRGAQAAYERALSIREEALGPNDPTVADNLNGLGVIRERMGDAGGALQYHQRALEIREKALGAAHPDVAASLNNLGNIRTDTGDYAAARALHERALAIREKALGAEHPDVAASLNNLAIAVRDLGDHAAAWWLLERVLAIWEKTFGLEHPNIAIACQNLAAVLVDLGDDAGSRLLAERARRLRSGGMTAGPLAGSLNARAGFETAQGYVAARTLLERALAIKEKTLGPTHPSVAFTLTSLATVTRKSGATEEVRSLFERALEIREKAFGPWHPDVGDTLDRLGEFLADTGDYAAALPIYERVLAINEKVQGQDHPHVGVVRQHLAEVLAAMGDVGAAVRMALAAESIGREHLRLVGRTLPEREALMFAAMRPVGLDVALTLLARPKKDASLSTAVVWDAVVRSRAVVLDEMASRRRALDTGAHPEIDALVRTLSLKREQLARLIVRGPAGSGEQYRRDLERARSERDDAERAVAEQSSTFRQEQLQVRFGFEEMKAALPPQSALVAFVRYRQHRFDKESGSGGPQPEAAYVAFVARAADAREPVVIPLGAAADLDDEIARWRKQMALVALAGGTAANAAESAVRRAGLQLRGKIWDPLAAHVADAKRVFIVPEGSLHLVNWEALPNANGGYLIEQAPLLHYLSAERDLAAQSQHTPGRGLVVVDSPLFDDRPRLAAPGRGSPVLRGPTPECGDLDWLQFEPLPASGREAETIARIWRQGSAATSVLRLTGRTATEAALKQRAAGARVLHLATHAFFLGNRCLPARDRQESNPSLNATENPLLLAGLALGGANRRKAAGADDEDGILTAEEVAALDLRGLEWAVLSGCDTGVGEVRAGEGVFGLRRAFQVAGARTVIMSLWPVDDENTRRWMTSVYEHRFARDAGTMEAMRAASLDQLRRRRQAGQSTHPFYWAGFIAAGDWR